MIYLVLSSQGQPEDFALVEYEPSRLEEPEESLDINEVRNHSKICATSHLDNGSAGVQNEENDKLIRNKADKYRRYEKILNRIDQDTSAIKWVVKGFFKITSKPWEILLKIFTPKSSDGMLIFVQFFIPLFFIWNVSEIELYLLEKLMKRLNVPASFLGMTIMSWGNNAPDMFNVASAMAKGMVDLALNAAVASEIHNILLGLGLPYLIYNLKVGKPIVFSSRDLYAFTLFFFCFFLLTFIIALKLNRNKLNCKFATYLIISYLIFLIMLFFFSFK